MTRFVAFLRGINVGGHTVKMDRLKALFEALGFEEVSTFIASGNVVFATEEEPADREKLERRIEAALKDALGYEVATFLRTDRELVQVAEHDAFSEQKQDGDNVYVLFLREEPDAATRKAVEGLSNEADVLRVHGREVYWLRRYGSLMDTTIGNKDFARALGPLAVNTNRNVNTVQRMAKKYAPEG